MGVCCRLQLELQQLTLRTTRDAEVQQQDLQQVQRQLAEAWKELEAATAAAAQQATDAAKAAAAARDSEQALVAQLAAAQAQLSDVQEAREVLQRRLAATGQSAQQQTQQQAEALAAAREAQHQAATQAQQLRMQLEQLQTERDAAVAALQAKVNWGFSCCCCELQ